jgi:hypothetical protein
MAQKPVLFLKDADKVEVIKQKASSDLVIKESISKLTKEADKLLTKNYKSVMDKTQTPPCGNKHEYMSLAKYFWYDSSKPDGKPYIRRDGQKNPECDNISDDKNFDEILKAIHILSWAYYFTNEDKYAEKATSLIHFWFLDEASYMAPNLNHAQMVTGRDTGRASGIIDTHDLPWLLDAVGLLRSSKHWKVSYETNLKQWLNDYLIWMTTSKNGVQESLVKNNHRIFFDIQIASIAMFCNKTDLAKKVLSNAKDLIAYQIEPDGKQPEELKRTLSLHYSTFNLIALFGLSNVAEKAGIDLWSFETKDGRSIKKALDYLLPYATGELDWNYPQIKPYNAKDFYSLLLQAADKYKDEKYRIAAQKIKEANKNNLIKILYE